MPLVVSSVTPNTELNQLGGDILSIVGTGFDPDFSQTRISFNDNTNCTIFAASSTEIKCIVDGFNMASLDTANPYTVNVTVNSVVETSMTVMLRALKQNGHTVSPNSVSPVLATNLTVTLESTYPHTLTNRTDFNATLVSRDDPTIERPLYVMSVNDTEKSLKIKFPGAESGNYEV